MYVRTNMAVATEDKARFFFETLDAVGGAIGFERVGIG